MNKLVYEMCEEILESKNVENVFDCSFICCEDCLFEI